MILNHRSERNYWSTEWVLPSAVHKVFSRAIRVLERFEDNNNLPWNQPTIFSSKPDGQSTADVPSLILRTARCVLPFVSER